ncbi:MAG: hypothetical protein ABIG95_00240 [Candidatus Woesearchaeota archaeon]
MISVPLLHSGPNFLDSRKDIIKYSGIVDLEGLYKALVKWFLDRKYDFYEDLYKDKPPELEIEWNASRKVNDFYKYRIKMSFHFYDLKEVEVIKDGKKRKMVKTRVWIIFDPILEYDWQNRWSKSEWSEKLLKFFVANVIKRELQLKYGDPLWYIYYRLHAFVKQYLGMEVGDNAY